MNRANFLQNYQAMTAPLRSTLHEQIYARLKHQVTEGTLAPGQRVPSLRALASELGIARGTVEAAYDRLIGEGWLVARGPAGTFVAEGTLSAPAATASTVRKKHALKSAARARQPELLRLGLPALDAFPRKLWTRLVTRHARSAGSLDRPEPAGHLPLRSAIAAYLQRARGVACDANQVFIVPGYRAALSLAADVVLRAGDAAWMESPGFPPTAQVLARTGVRLVPVPVDADGVVVADGIRLAPRARLAVVTPSHQSPLGVSLAMNRRTALLAWASAADAWILEDDYDGEYRYTGHPLPALQSLDPHGRVLYAGTFSKVMFPGIRLAYLVVPPAQIDAFQKAAEQSPHGGCPELYQAVVAEFLSQGHLARHVKKMRALYARRRNQFVEALAPLERDGLFVERRPGGMHLVIRSTRAEADTAIAGRLQAAGFAVQALSTWCANGRGPQGLLAGFANVATPAQATRIAARMRRAMGAPSLSDQIP
ncbi:MocR-like pyridoxine biosynthesis transcription factor PdxR [Variovorax ginsengisoli]|uniref:GntR family transcriptional regulator/MocR family aminotransferase n=1 Tax=Variovorax ginsengisoli TaxID=363844 RepID=A0ABT9S4P0_9BURK|nr:PLP-dependent aminotransferase family protein [Variovorax ginsengisoli]MDP9899324.1 GntR family transcriptional regulator/MocR family aminotransferase [Variovorax ginsengisoli]